MYRLNNSNEVVELSERYSDKECFYSFREKDFAKYVNFQKN